MDILSLVILLGVIVGMEEILNNQLKVSKRLLDWLDRQQTSEKKSNQLTR
jgi:hypothetical protein